VKIIIQNENNQKNSREIENKTIDVYVGLFNIGNNTQNFIIDFTSLGLPVGSEYHYMVRELWNHTNLGVYNTSINLEIVFHGVQVFRVYQVVSMQLSGQLHSIAIG